MEAAPCAPTASTTIVTGVVAIIPRVKIAAVVRGIPERGVGAPERIPERAICDTRSGNEGVHSEPGIVRPAAAVVARAVSIRRPRRSDVRHRNIARPPRRPPDQWIAHLRVEFRGHQRTIGQVDLVTFFGRELPAGVLYDRFAIVNSQTAQ